MMTAEIVRAEARPFAFDGDALVTVPYRESWGAVIKTWCDALSVDHDAQLNRLARLAKQGEGWATTSIMEVVAADGKIREMAVLPRRSLWMWLAGIPVSRVRPEARAKLLRYKEECVDALDAFWTGRTVGNRQVDRSSRADLVARLGGYLADAVAAGDAHAARVIHKAVGQLVGVDALAGAQEGSQVQPLGRVEDDKVRGSGAAPSFAPIVPARRAPSVESEHHKQCKALHTLIRQGFRGHLHTDPELCPCGARITRVNRGLNGLGPMVVIAMRCAAGHRADAIRMPARTWGDPGPLKTFRYDSAEMEG